VATHSRRDLAASSGLPSPETTSCFLCTESGPLVPHLTRRAQVSSDEHVLSSVADRPRKICEYAFQEPGFEEIARSRVCSVHMRRRVAGVESS
jgi:hypothetical protein